MTHKEESENWIEAALGYGLGIVVWGGAMFGVPLLLGTIGWRWVVAGVAAILAAAVAVRAVQRAVRWFCDATGRACPGFARGRLPTEWTIDDVGVTLREVGDGGREVTVRYDELQAVLIETTSGGPWVEDFFYVLCEEELSLSVPLGVACEHHLADHLFALPGFDHGAAIAASGSTEDAVFVCWEATATDGSPVVQSNA